MNGKHMMPGMSPKGMGPKMKAHEKGESPAMRKSEMGKKERKGR